jgi:hypothetical protein
MQGHLYVTQTYFDIRNNKILKSEYVYSYVYTVLNLQKLIHLMVFLKTIVNLFIILLEDRTALYLKISILFLFHI